MELDLLNSRGKSICALQNVAPSTTVQQLKERIALEGKGPATIRQLLRLEQKGPALKDADTLQAAGLKSGDKLYLKDLGPQIGWSTVFLAEYAGPLVVYLWIYTRPWLFYGELAGRGGGVRADVVNLAAGCYVVHYAKRLLETIFVHRFSHSTMPLRNLFKNCSYYWGFTAYVAYHVNHPLYTPPSTQVQVYSALALFTICELGNLSSHLLLRDLRPAGTTERRIPYPNRNPLTMLFNLVSCPNYTYEFGAWAAFTVMTQCVPAGLFALAGLYQMSVWAIGKHKQYRKEFKEYPRGRKAIIPFLL